MTATTDCANAITVEPSWRGNEYNISVRISCQPDLGGCGWSYRFAGAPDLRRIPWSRVVAEVEKHLDGKAAP